eukprot:TRINITY_DN2927_c0_g1_i1.p3 TRINITY_DN2927_c0_g1~~TRINITY_DN2927_c0_g1_i1.p3  ORF type:complete len:167 (+),score=7.35 TRINITY_DN2927_c0_g1_i1:1251-1751(+)
MIAAPIYLPDDLGAFSRVCESLTSLTSLCIGEFRTSAIRSPGDLHCLAHLKRLRYFSVQAVDSRTLLSPMVGVHEILARLHELEVFALSGDFAVPGKHAGLFAKHPALRCYVTHPSSVPDARGALASSPWIHVESGLPRRSGWLPDTEDVMDPSALPPSSVWSALA